MASLSKVKDQLSRYVDEARQGQRIRILVRGRPAADLVPVPAGDAVEQELEDLERAGLVRRGKGGVPEAIFTPGPRVRGPGLSRSIVEERRRSR